MGDSTAMTVEFLRARLLSERSVSRTARQRADQLGKRVMELEEQLRMVILQRKKAEKAAVEVLAMLESKGIGDSSEVIDSSSDQDEVCDGPVEGEDTLKEEENSAGSRMGRSEVEDRLSGSELDVSPSQGSLSWKSHGSNPDSHEKERVKQVRQRHRRSSFMHMVESSSKRHLGKSCRKIRQREMGSAAEDEADKPVLPGAHVNGEAILAGYSDEQPDTPGNASRSETKQVLVNTSIQSSFDPSKETNAGLYDNGSDRDEDMEKVLEHQAQLIGQYQAEENAQREWEEKYNENQSSAMGLSGLVNEPGKIENNEEPEKEAVELTVENPIPEEVQSQTATLSNSEQLTAPSPLGASMPGNQELYGMDQEKCGSSKEAKALPNDIVPPDLTTIQNSSSYNPYSEGLLTGPFDISGKAIESSSLELAFSVKESSGRTANGKQTEHLSFEGPDASSHSNAGLRRQANGFLDSPSIGSPSSISSSSRISKWRSSNIQGQFHQQLPQASSDSLGGVLEALQHAKISLQLELNNLPSNQDTLAIATSTDPQFQGMDYDNMLGIPIGSAGLFRLPTDSFTQARSSGPKFNASRLRLAAIRPDVECATGVNDCQYPMTSYVEAGPRVSVGKQYFDPSITSGVGISGMYSLPPSYTARKRTATRDVFGGPYFEVKSEMPSEQRYLYDGHSTWPDMRRL